MGIYWVVFGMVAVVLLVTCSALKSEERWPSITWIVGLSLVIVMLLTGPYWFRQKPFQGTGEIIGKDYQESYTKRVWSGKHFINRTVPECWGLTIRPDIEPKTKPEHYIAAICINKDAWDKVEVGMTINVSKEK